MARIGLEVELTHILQPSFKRTLVFMAFLSGLHAILFAGGG